MVRTRLNFVVGIKQIKDEDGKTTKVVISMFDM